MSAPQATGSLLKKGLPLNNQAAQTETKPLFERTKNAVKKSIQAIAAFFKDLSQRISSQVRNFKDHLNSLLSKTKPLKSKSEKASEEGSTNPQPSVSQKLPSTSTTSLSSENLSSLQDPSSEKHSDNQLALPFKLLPPINQRRKGESNNLPPATKQKITISSFYITHEEHPASLLGRQKQGLTLPTNQPRVNLGIKIM